MLLPIDGDFNLISGNFPSNPNSQNISYNQAVPYIVYSFSVEGKRVGTKNRIKANRCQILITEVVNQIRIY